MKQILIMIAEQVGKGIGEGLRDYMKRFVSMSSLLLLLAGSAFANWQLFQINANDRKEHKAEVREYAEALKTANRMAIEAQADRQICLTELNRVSAELTELRAEIRILKQKR